MTTNTVSHDTQPKIQPRKMNFDYSDVNDKKYWFDNNSVMTTLFASLSAIFPPGEQQFIYSVRHYQDQITDPELKKQIRGFIGQEGHHSHQHRKANDYLDSTGLYATRLEKHLERFIVKAREVSSPEDQLAQTVAAEHITAVMAEYALTHPEFTKHMTKSVRELILWHAVEEIEHKSVAYEVYMQCVGDKKRLDRNMRLVMIEFPLRTFCYQVALLYWDKKIPSARDLYKTGKILFGKDGMMRKIRKPLNRFFEKDFHPWDHDNTALIDQWKSEHEYPAELAHA